MNATYTPASARNVFPLEKCYQCAGCARVVTKEQLFGVGIIRVGSAQEKCEAEEIAVELDRQIGIARNHGAVVKTTCAQIHLDEADPSVARSSAAWRPRS